MRRCGSLVLVAGATVLAIAGNAFALPLDRLAPPANDNFADRASVTLSGNSAAVPGTTVDATFETGEPNAFTGDKTVWYVWVAAQSGMLTVGTCGTGAMHFANVYTHAGETPTLAGLSPRLTAASNPGCGFQNGGLQGYVVTAGTAYYIQVLGYLGGSGPFNLTLDFSNEFPLTVNKTGSTGKGRVTSNPAGIDCGVMCSSASQSYATGTSITLTAQPANGTSEIGGWSEPGCSGTTCTFTLNGPKTVAVRFDRVGGPPNDAFGSATIVTGAEVTQTGSNVDATVETDEPHAADTYPTVWYRWTAPSSGLLTVSTCTSDFFAVANVYRGSSLVTLVEQPIMTNAGCSSTGVRYAFSVTGGLTYHIQVGGYLGAIGSFTLGLSLANEFALAFTKSGTGHGIVTSSPAGISCGISCTGQTSGFTAGSTVTLTASHPSTTSFDGWTGAPGCAAELVCEVQMTQVRNVTAIFTRVSGPPNDDFANRATITGGAPVTPSNVDASRETGEPGPPEEKTLWYSWSPSSQGTAVASTCGASTWTTLAVYTGTSVDALTPIAAPATGCPGGGSGSVMTWTVTPGDSFVLQIAGYGGALGNLRLELTFAGHKRLTVNKTVSTGTGRITSSPTGISCDAGCSSTSWDFAHGTVVTLTAEADLGSTFTAWGGPAGLGCSGLTCEVTMTEAKQVTGTFTRNSYGLNVGKPGTGSGTVSSTPAGIDCGPDCSETYTHGTNVTLTAAPATGSTFGGWSGACSGAAATCAVAMDAVKNVTATFILNTYALTVQRAGTGNGTISSTPVGINCGSDCDEVYGHGTAVALAATPAPGSSFAGWSGSGCSGTAACAVSMTEARTVLATFTLDPVTPPPPPAVQCKVPRLKGKTLAGARTALRNGNCALGRVTRAYSRTVRRGRVIRQSPAAGRTLPRGGKVAVTISRGRRP
jgi:hypothetical protein